MHANHEPQAPKRTTRTILVWAGVALAAGLIAAWLALRPWAAADMKDAPFVGPAPSSSHSSASASALAPPGPVTAATRPTGFETCGLPDPAATVDTTAEASREAALDRLAAAELVESLEHATSDKDRAVGLLLRISSDTMQGFLAEQLAAQDACGGEPTCTSLVMGDPRESIRRYAGPATQALAGMATSSSDPFVYATAFGACARFAVGDASAAACQMLSAAQWTRIDPNNSVPWLYEASQSAERGDLATLAEAMNRVAQARSSQDYRDEAEAIAEAAVREGPGEASATMLVIGASAAWPLPSYQVASKYCSGPSLEDSNRRQICDSIAHRFADQGSNFMEQRIGIRMGERVGWPPEQVAAMRLRSDIEMLGYARGATSGTINDCQGLARLRAYRIRQASLGGEVAAARAWIAASGKSMAELASELATEKAAEREANETKAAAASTSATNRARRSGS
jgi:hypothetical protein